MTPGPRKDQDTRSRSAISLLPTLRLVRLLTLGAFFWLPAAFIPGGALAGVLFLIILLALCWRDLGTIPAAAELGAERALPARFALDVEQKIKLTLSNRSVRSLQLTVRDELPDVFELMSELPPSQIPAGGAAEFSYSVLPLKRGAFAYGNVVLRVSGAAGLVQKQISLPVPD
ncbi:MAG: hypothetical protein ACREOR_04305, partial [Candidatus Binatia bacterium]